MNFIRLRALRQGCGGRVMPNGVTWTGLLLAFVLLSSSVANAQGLINEIYADGFEIGQNFLFEDPFEPDHSVFWRESNGNWAIDNGAYIANGSTGINELALEPRDFVLDLEISQLDGAGIWIRRSDSAGILLSIGADDSQDSLVWRVFDGTTADLTLNPSNSGVVSRGGSYTITVRVLAGRYEAFVDGQRVTELSTTDILDAGAIAPVSGAVGLDGQSTQTRHERIRLWGENESTYSIQFLSDQSIIFQSVGETYDFSAQVVDSSGVAVPELPIEWALPVNALVSLAVSDTDSATVQVDSLGIDSVPLEARVPGLGVSAEAQITLAELAVDAHFFPSVLFIDNGAASGDVRLTRSPETESILVGDVLISGDQAGVLERVVAKTVTATEVVLETEPATIVEAFRNLDVTGTSAKRRFTLRYEAGSESARLHYSGSDGQPMARAVDPNLFSCETENGTNFGLDFARGSIDETIDVGLVGTLRIVDGALEDFSILATGSYGLSANAGTLTFATTLAGTVTCTIDLPRLESPRVPVSVFSFQLGFLPVLGVEVGGSIDGPSFSIDGPRGAVSGSFEAGLRYAPVGGWQKVADANWTPEASLFGGEFSPEIQFAIRAGTFAALDLQLIANLGWGFDFTSLELANLTFATVRGELGLDASFVSPFDPALRDYTGPDWGLGADLTGDYSLVLGGELATLLDRLSISANVDIGGSIFNPIRVDLEQAPSVTSLLQTCSSANCVFGPVAGDRVDFTLTTDDPEHQGRVDFLGWLNGEDPLVDVASGNLVDGASLVRWSPDESDPEGVYAVYPRLEIDSLSRLFPYAPNPRRELEPIVIGETRTLTVTKSGVGDGRVTSDIPGIDCGDTCEAEFGLGSTVTLTFEPDFLVDVVSWGGVSGCGTSLSCDVPMDALRNVDLQLTATTQEYFSRSVFSSALPTPEEVANFDDYASGQAISSEFNGFVSFSGAQPPTIFFGAWDLFGNGAGPFFEGALLPQPSSNQTAPFVMTFQEPVLAVGMDLYDDGPDANVLSMTIRTTSGATFSIDDQSDLSGWVGFLGFASGERITSVTLVNNFPSRGPLEIDWLRILR